MFQRISTANKPEGNGAASASRSRKPKKAGGLSWRKDGEREQIVILSKEDFALPLILNFSAARIFLLCNGRNSLLGIAQLLAKEFKRKNYARILDDVKKQVGYFFKKGIVKF